MHEYHILFITNKPELVNECRSLLKPGYGSINVASNEAEAVSIFDSRRPEVIVFGCSSPELSQDIYIGMYSNSSMIKQTQHRAILLCDHVDIETAYDKCVRNVFFDYVVMSPRFDRIRINLSIRNVLLSIKQADNELSMRELARSGRKVAEYDSEIRDIIEKSSFIKSKTDKSFLDMSNQIKSNIREFSSELININNKLNHVMTKEDLDKEVDKLSINIIDNKIQKSKDDITKGINDHVNRIKDSQARHSGVISNIDSLSKSVKMKVLIIEDNQLYGDIVKTIMSKSGEYDVYLVSTIHEGMVFVITNRPDIVFLDYELPDGDASVLLEKIRCVPSSKNIPVIILTSHNNKDVYTSTIMLGAQDFLVKPASEEAIMGKAKEWLGSTNSVQR